MPMMDFADFLAESAKGKKNTTGYSLSSTIPQHATGFMYLDYGCGSYVNVYDDNENPMYTYHNIGINSGSVNTVISKSQGGKTTLATQMAEAIIEPYYSKLYTDRFVQEIAKKTGTKVNPLQALPFIEIFDTEMTSSTDYAKKLGHYTNKQVNQRIKLHNISTDTELVELLEKHVEFKVKYMSPQICPMLDMFGNPILEYPPTVIIIDSMTQLLLEAVDDPEKVGSKKEGLQAIYEAQTKGPAGALRAKVISALYSQLVSIAKRYNIIVFSINHINKMPAVMGIPVKQFRGLKGGETLSGGERAIYLSSSILRLDVIKNVGGMSSTSVDLGTKEDGEPIKGFISIASWIKCKSNSKSNTCQLGFTDVNGYDQLLSNLWHAKEIGDLQKKGNFYYVDKHPDLPFTFKNYTDVFASHPELFMAFYDQLRGRCEKILDNPDRALKRNEQIMKEIRDEIHDDYESGDMSRGDAMDMDDMFASIVND